MARQISLFYKEIRKAIRYQSLPYNQSLNGLRALAAWMVVFFHCPIAFFHLQFGWVGVNLFFILSGYFITKILLANKTSSLRVYLGGFYTRRMSRIFPLYFFYLVVAIGILYLFGRFQVTADPLINQGFNDIRYNGIFLLTFTYNFAEVINQFLAVPYAKSMFFGHLWTLCVEMQFYLFFPLVVFYVPEKYLKKCLLALIFATPLLRLLFVDIAIARTTDLFWIGNVLYVASPFQADTLSVGACIALFRLDEKEIKLRKIFFIVLAGTAALSAVHLYFFDRYAIPAGLSSFGFDNPVYQLLSSSPDYWLNNRYFYSIPLLNFLFAMLTILAIRRKLFTPIFENRFLCRTGTISYGIYIYHLLISFLFAKLLPATWATDQSLTGVVFQFGLLAIYILILLLVSRLSYVLFEKRFLT